MAIGSPWIPRILLSSVPSIRGRDCLVKVVCFRGDERSSSRPQVASNPHQGCECLLANISKAQFVAITPNPSPESGSPVDSLEGIYGSLPFSPERPCLQMPRLVVEADPCESTWRASSEQALQSKISWTQRSGSS